MTPREMQSEFMAQLRQFQGAPWIESKDIFVWLNDAQDQLVRGLYSGIIPDRLGRGFEQSQEVIDDLEKILLQNYETIAIWEPGFRFNQVYYAEKASLPEDRLRIINYRADIFYQRGGITWDLDASPSPSPDIAGPRRYPTGEFSEKSVLLKSVQSDDVYRTLLDPLATTHHTEPLVQQSQEHLVIFTDNTFIVDKVYLSYLKRPRTIVRAQDPQEDQGSELPGILHREVVSLAVQMYLSSNRQLQPDR